MAIAHHAHNKEDIPMQPEILDQHRWLEQFAGTWTVRFEATGDMPDDGAHGQWTEDVRMLGGIWAVFESTGGLPGGSAATNIMSIGYDPQKARYVGTFVSSMMANLWTYEGLLDDTGKVLTLESTGPDFFGGTGNACYQDIIIVTDADNRLFVSRIEQADGSWKTVMTSHYTRVS